MAAEYTEEAVETLVTVMRDSDAPAAVRVSAADKLLDRSHGKPTIHIEEPNNKIDPELMKKLEVIYVERMAIARERQRKVLIERGIIRPDEDI